MEKSHYIQLYRFIFVMLIAVMHLFSPWAKGAYIGVDFFFILAGFLLVGSKSKLEKEYPNDSSEKLSFKYLCHRVKKLFPYMVLYLLLEAVYLFLVKGLPVFKIIKIMVFDVWDICFLYLTGMGTSGYHISGITWYMSALVIGGWIVFYLYAKKESLFVYVLAPLFILFMYSRFATIYGHMNLYSQQALPGIAEGLLRGIAGMSLGIICYKIYKILRTIDKSHTSRLLFRSLEFLLVLIIICAMFVVGCSQLDFILVVMFAFVIILSFSNLNVLIVCEKMLMGGGNLILSIFDYLGKISLTIYLSHVYIGKLVQKYIHFPSRFLEMTGTLVIIVFCSMLFELLISQIIEKINLKQWIN